MSSGPDVLRGSSLEAPSTVKSISSGPGSAQSDCTRLVATYILLRPTEEANHIGSADRMGELAEIIRGVPGIGKTALGDAVSAMARAQGFEEVENPGKYYMLPIGVNRGETGDKSHGTVGAVAPLLAEGHATEAEFRDSQPAGSEQLVAHAIFP